MITVKKYLSCLTLLAVATILPCAIAQETDAIEKPQVYQVELIVFRHADQSRTTGEIPRTPEPEMADILEQDLPRLGATESPDSSYVMQAEQVPFWYLLNRDDLMLNDVSQQLESLSAYTVLSHTGWLQSAPDVAEAEDIALLDLGIGPEQATGSVKLLKRRYLHLAVDVSLAGSGREVFNVFSTPETAPAINESRRMRLEKLVYFDQPQFGIIAMVARSEAELELAP
jgi:hypothetical protein